MSTGQQETIFSHPLKWAALPSYSLRLRLYLAWWKANVSGVLRTQGCYRAPWPKSEPHTWPITNYEDGTFPSPPSVSGSFINGCVCVSWDPPVFCFMLWWRWLYCSLILSVCLLLLIINAIWVHRRKLGNFSLLEVITVNNDFLFLKKNLFLSNFLHIT